MLIIIIFWILAYNIENKANLQFLTKKRKFSMTPINDRQLSGQKVRQKISVIITNTNTFVFKTKPELKCQNEPFFYVIRCVCFEYWEFLRIFWRDYWRSIINWRHRKLPLRKPKKHPGSPQEATKKIQDRNPEIISLVFCPNDETKRTFWN